MKVKVYSNFPLDGGEKLKLAGLMKESKCPNESLRITFPTRYQGIDEDSIYFDKGVHKKCVTEIEY